MKVPALSVTGRPGLALRVPLVVSGYTMVFFGALLPFLWAIGGRLDTLLALPQLQDGWWRWIGIVLMMAGAPLMVQAMWSLHSFGAGWPISHLPPQYLVARGPYRYMRHPIYVGYTLALAGVGIATGSPGRGFGAAALLTVGWLLYALGFEEPHLARRHGRSYLAYRQMVPVLPWVSGSALRAGVAWAWHRMRPGLDWLANKPVLVRLGPSIWVSWGTGVAVGAGLAVWTVTGLLVSGGAPLRLAVQYVLGAAVCVVVGGRIAWLCYHPKLVMQDVCAAIRSVGFVSWGGFLGLFTFSVWFSWAAGLDTLWLIDCTSLGSLLCYSFGRLGCHAYGCCYGRPWHHGIRYSHPEAKVIREQGLRGAARRVPTQLLSALHGAALRATLLAVAQRPVPAGTLTAVGLVLYALGRFAVECLRDQPQYSSLNLSSGQIASIVAAAIGFILLFSIDGSPSCAAAVRLVDAWAQTPLWPGVVVMGLTFTTCGFHWRRVGRW